MEFPVSTLTAVTSIGSHYTPLVLDTGDGLPNRPNKFFFETNWFELQGLKAMVEDWWEENSRGITQCRGPVEWWHSQSSALRQFLKGWGTNLGKQSRVVKANLLARI
jgi:hypothetical protein